MDIWSFATFPNTVDCLNNAFFGETQFRFLFIQYTSQHFCYRALYGALQNGTTANLCNLELFHSKSASTIIIVKVINNALTRDQKNVCYRETTVFRLATENIPLGLFTFFSSITSTLHLWKLLTCCENWSHTKKYRG